MIFLHSFSLRLLSKLSTDQIVQPLVAYHLPFDLEALVRLQTQISVYHFVTLWSLTVQNGQPSYKILISGFDNHQHWGRSRGGSVEPWNH